MEILSANKCKLKWIILLALTICAIGQISPAVSQQRPEEAQKIAADPQTPTGVLSLAEIALSIGVLAFTAAILGLGAWMRVRGVVNSDAFFKMFGLVIVIGPSLFLITAGYSKDQITPVIGLLGTALGFAFGKRMGDDVSLERRNPKAPKDQE
jgi:hypothetical protein